MNTLPLFYMFGFYLIKLSFSKFLQVENPIHSVLYLLLTYGWVGILCAVELNCTAAPIADNTSFWFSYTWFLNLYQTMLSCPWEVTKPCGYFFSFLYGELSSFSTVMSFAFFSFLFHSILSCVQKIIFGQYKLTNSLTLKTKVAMPMAPLLYKSYSSSTKDFGPETDTYGPHFWNFKWAVVKELSCIVFANPFFLLFWLFSLGLAYFLSIKPLVANSLCFFASLALYKQFLVEAKKKLNMGWKDWVLPMGSLSLKKAHVVALAQIYFVLSVWSSLVLSQAHSTTPMEILFLLAMVGKFLGTFLAIRSLTLAYFYGVPLCRGDFVLALGWLFFLPVLLHLFVSFLFKNTFSGIYFSMVAGGPKTGPITQGVRYAKQNGFFDAILTTAAVAGVGVQIYDAAGKYKDASKYKQLEEHFGKEEMQNMLKKAAEVKEAPISPYDANKHGPLNKPSSY